MFIDTHFENFPISAVCYMPFGVHATPLVLYLASHVNDNLFLRIKFEYHFVLDSIIENYDDFLNLNHCRHLLQRPIAGRNRKTLFRPLGLLTWLIQ